MLETIKTFETWYEATAQRGSPSGPLIGRHQADVCIVGAVSRGGFARHAEFMRREFDEPLEVMTNEETRAILRTRRYFGALRNPAIGYAWSGIMGYALHKMPLVGRSNDGQWHATAFGGHGLNTAAMAGRLIAEAVLNGEDTYRRFAAFPPVWPAGPLGRIGVQTGYRWM